MPRNSQPTSCSRSGISPRMNASSSSAWLAASSASAAGVGNGGSARGSERIGEGTEAAIIGALLGHELFVVVDHMTCGARREGHDGLHRIDANRGRKQRGIGDQQTIDVV